MYLGPAALMAGTRSSVIDIGCGDGYGYHALIGHNALSSYWGIDSNSSDIAKARTLLTDPNHNVVCGGWLAYPDSELEPADFVFCIEVLEHVPAELRKSFVEKCARFTKRNLFISTPPADRNAHGRLTIPECRALLQSAGLDVVVVDAQWTTLYVCSPASAASRPVVEIKEACEPDVILPPTTIACVYKTGGDFTAEYVERLVATVSDHTELPYRFVCLTDSNEKFSCETIPLTEGLPGWWSKLELFKTFWGRTVYFDLDTMLVGNIDPLLCYDGPVALLQDWYSEETKLSTGVMVWNSPLRFLYPTDSEKRAILQAPQKMDQYFVVERLERAKWRVDNVCELLPIVSYKKHCRDQGVPDDARVVCFHGRPRPHEIGWRLA